MPETSAALKTDAPTNEAVLYTNNSDIWITPSRAIIGPTTLALDSVRWARLRQEKRSKGAKWAVGLGLFFLFGSFASDLPDATSPEEIAAQAQASYIMKFWSAVAILAGVLVLWLRKVRFSAVLTTKDQEQAVLTSANRPEVEGIVSAINRQLVSQGKSPP